jgi:DNA (cytosine-5)-methyltransferase 3A
MKVVSLFNGMGCIWLALDKLNIKVTKRYSSEVDKYAIQVNDANYPDTIQLGDVRNVKGSDLGHIDLLAGGSPCQSFSFAGKRKGMSTKDSIEILTLEHYLELKSQNFEFEGQSYLFWEYMRILSELREINPEIKFLLENVEMGAKWEKILTRAIGINPIHINSALLSAQNRKRVYWTNIGAEADGLFGELYCKIPQPKDKGILLKDILEIEVDEKYYIKNPKFGFNGMDLNNKSNTLRIGGQASQTDKHNFDLIKCDKKGNIKENQDKASCFTAGGNSGGNHSDMDIICVASRGRNPENPKSRESGLHTEQQLEPRNDGKTNCLTSVQKDNYIVFAPGYEQDNRAYFEEGKSGTMDIKSGRQKVFLSTHRIRRLTPVECCRLQTVSDDYFHKDGKQIVSDTQIYKQLGNGWTVDVICHIFSYLKA